MHILALLAALFMSMPDGAAIGERVAVDNAMAATAATMQEGCFAFEGLDSWGRCEATARVAIVFGYWEGRGKASPDGHNDGGAACGVMQVHGPRYATCKAVRGSLLLGYREGLARMHDDLRACVGVRETYTRADLRRALGRYATGKCGAWQGEAGRRLTLALGSEK